MRALRVLLPLVVVGAIVLAVVMSVSGAARSSAFRIRREALRREMVERSAVARGLGGPAGAEEARAVLQWWFESCSALRNRFPREAATPERGGAVQKAGDGEDEWYRYAGERAQALRGGYVPVLSGTDQGLRLDILDIRPGQRPETHERALRIDFALWGAPRRIEPEVTGPGRAAGAQHLVIPLAFRQLAFHFVDAAGKPFGDMTGSGDPYMLLKDPERLSGELPPGVALGTWWVDPFPREAARAEMSVRVQAQGMTAAALETAFRWDVPLRDEWKLLPGETFGAETRAAPDARAPRRR